MDAQLCKEPWLKIPEINLVAFVVQTAFCQVILLRKQVSIQTNASTVPCCRFFRVMETSYTNVFLDSFSHQWCQRRLFSMPVTLPPQPTHSAVLGFHRWSSPLCTICKDVNCWDVNVLPSVFSCIHWNAFLKYLPKTFTTNVMELFHLFLLAVFSCS